MQKQETGTGRAAFRQGLLYGLGLGVFFIICNVILSFAKSGTFLAGGIYSYMSTSTGNGALFSIGGLLVQIVVFLLVGLRAAQLTGRVATGALAGLWTGLISAVITDAYAIVSLFVSISPGQNTLAQQLSSEFGIITIVFAIFGIVLALVIGLAIGALGGLIGKRLAPPPAPFSQPSTYYPGRPPSNWR
jgi:hypothetical protein